MNRRLRMSQSNEPRKTVTLGDILEQIDKESGQPKLDKLGRKTYSLKCYIPPDVGSITLKNGDYINFRQLSDQEVTEMPAWKQPLAQLKVWIGLK